MRQDEILRTKQEEVLNMPAAKISGYLPLRSEFEKVLIV